MKAMTTSPRGEYRTRHPMPANSSAESPPDRELRRLHNLSAEVGAACSAWLSKRGLKTRSWGDFNLSRSPRKRPRVEIPMENHD